MNKLLILALLTALGYQGYSQERKAPSLGFENLIGLIRSNSNLTVHKTIQGNFKFMNSTSLSAYYQREKGLTELVSVNSIGYQFHKNLTAYSGLQYHFIKGFMPHIAINFSYVTPGFLFSITPYYNFMPFKGIETIAIVEFKPRLSEKLRLFTRVQGFYGHNLDAGDWARGMFYSRLGLSLNQYTFGLANQFDYYNPGNKKILDYGAFFKLAL